MRLRHTILLGLIGIVLASPADRSTHRFVGEFAWGETTYDGSLMDQNGDYAGPYITKSPNVIATVEFTYGREIVGGNSRLGVTPYAGGGLRMWSRGKYESDPYGYNELYTWFYLPLGLRTELRPSESVTIALDASARPIILGSIVLEGGASGRLGNKIGYKIEGPIKVQASPNVAVELRPWYEYSAFGKGNVWYYGDIIGYEPDSTTHQYGGILSILW